MMYLCKQCGFPWLISNVFDGDKPLGNANQACILTASNGVQVGLMGLVEKYSPHFLDLSNGISNDKRMA